MLIADWDAGLDVEPDDRSGKPVREERRDAPDRAWLALHVEQRHVALGRRVELENLRNPETIQELDPHVRPQAIAAAHPQPVTVIVRIEWRFEQVPAQFADVL